MVEKLTPNLIRRFALFIVLVFGIFGVFSLTNPILKKNLSKGSIQSGHAEVGCVQCHTDAPSSLRQQVQANLRHAVGLRDEGVDFAYQAVTSDQCLECHARPNERHPIYRFREPRFVEATAQIDAKSCLGCHTEHHDQRVSAPEPIPDKASFFQDTRTVDVENMFNAVNAVNDAARGIYTTRIVGPGLKAGLKFGEDWAEPGVDAGPLPALFLRLVASQMETRPSRLGLYLGSDEPINKSNLFDEAQSIAFELMKETKQASITQVTDIGFVGMYPDIASAGPCVVCHNEHPDSPKTNWELNDLMGATTWTYPTQEIGAQEYLSTTEEFFQSIEAAYGLYIEKAARFDVNIKIGAGWPDGDELMLPDKITFMTEVRKAASISMVEELILTSTLVPPEKLIEVLE